MSNPQYQRENPATLPAGTRIKTRTDTDGEIQVVDVEQVTGTVTVGGEVIANIEVAGAAVSSTNPVPVSPPLVGYHTVHVTSSTLPDGAATYAAQTDGTQRGQIYDQQTARRARVSPIGSVMTDQPTRLVGTQFGPANDISFWALTNTGAASGAAVATGVCTLTSGTANNGFGNVASQKNGWFIFANPNFWRAPVRVSAVSVALCTRRFGAMNQPANVYATPTDGFGFEISAAGVLSCNAWKGGAVSATVSSGSFNGDVASFTVDTNVHFYEIIYFVAGVWYFVDGILLHKFTPTTAPLANIYSLKAAATCFNQPTGTTSGVMELWAMTIERFGKLSTAATFINIKTAGTFILKITPGMLQRILINGTGNPAGTDTIILYDNTTATGTTIATVYMGKTGVAAIDCDVPFQNGLVVVTNSTTDITIVFE